MQRDDVLFQALVSIAEDLHALRLSADRNVSLFAASVRVEALGDSPKACTSAA